MKRIRKRPLAEVVQITSFHQSSERAALELSRFINFIRYHNPDIDISAATWTAAYFLHELPNQLLSDPEMMQALNTVAKRFSQH